MTLVRTASTPLAALGLLALTAALMVGCSPEPKPSTTPTAAFASEEEAFAAAEETYRAYNEALNQLDSTDPDSVEVLFQFTSGAFEADDRETFSMLQAEGLTLAGDSEVIFFEGATTQDHFSKAIALVCVDVSNVDVTNAAGESKVNPNRADINALDVTFVLDSGKMLIDSAIRVGDDACPSS